MTSIMQHPYLKEYPCTAIVEGPAGLFEVPSTTSRDAPRDLQAFYCTAQRQKVGKGIGNTKM